MRTPHEVEPGNIASGYSWPMLYKGTCWPSHPGDIEFKSLHMVMASLIHQTLQIKLKLKVSIIRMYTVDYSRIKGTAIRHYVGYGMIWQAFS